MTENDVERALREWAEQYMESDEFLEEWGKLAREFEHENPEGQWPTPECLSSGRIRQIAHDGAELTDIEKGHVATCRRCALYIPQFIGLNRPGTDETPWFVQARLQSVARRSGRQPFEFLFRPNWWKVNMPRKMGLALAGSVGIVVAVTIFGTHLSSRHEGDNELYSVDFIQLNQAVLSSGSKGGTVDRSMPTPLAPVNTAVRTSRPQFRWAAVNGKSQYEILLRRGGTHPLRKKVFGNSWQPATKLDPGIYKWSVGFPGEARASATYNVRVLPSEVQNEIFKQEASLGADDERLAALYLKNGLFMEALGPLQRLYNESHDSRLLPYLAAAKAASGKP